MRTLSTLYTLTLAATVAAVGLSAIQAQDRTKDEPVKIVVFERIQDLNLTDAQESRIADIQKEFKPKVQEAAKELATLVKEEMTKLTALLTPEQVRKIEELKEERTEHRQECVAHVVARLKEVELTDAEMARIGEIRKEFGPNIEKAMKELEGVLTEEQKKTREEALKAGKKRGEILNALQLTGPQRDKVETVAKSVATLVREESEKIHDVIEDKLQLADSKEERRENVRDRTAHRVTNVKDLNLTEEQKTKAASIRDEYRPKIHEAGNKLRGLIKEEVKQIVAVIKG